MGISHEYWIYTHLWRHYHLQIQATKNLRYPKLHKITLESAVMLGLYNKHTFNVDINIISHSNWNYHIVIACTIMNNLELWVSVLMNAFHFVLWDYLADIHFEQFCISHFLHNKKPINKIDSSTVVQKMIYWARKENQLSRKQFTNQQITIKLH